MYVFDVQQVSVFTHTPVYCLHLFPPECSASRLSMAEQEPLLEVVPIHHCLEHCDATVALLEEQWPHEKVIRAKRLQSMTEFSCDKLPCHFVLLRSDPSVEQEKTVIGHSLLQQADGRSDGKSAIMYSVVIRKDLRGKGYGRVIMRETERYALMQGYSHMYLSTEDQQGFYHRLGYQECEPITSLGKNSKRLTPNQVEALESLFARRAGTGGAPKSGNTWMKKRLIEEYPMQDPYPREKLAKHVCYALSGDCRTEEEERLESYGLFVSMPWQQQAGPSCGLVTVSMVAQAVKCHSGLSESGMDVEPCACTGPLSDEPCSGEGSQSLLQVASQLGISRDGEVFCAYNLAYLARKTHGLAMEVQSIGPETGSVILSNLALGKPCIIPYDRSVANHQPTLAEGTRAHWAIITGLVVTTPANQVPLSELSAVKWLSSHAMEDGTSCKLVECSETSQPEGSECLEKLLSGWESTYAICVHGMSRTPFVCSLKSLFESNANLRKAKSAHVKAAVDLEHLRNKIIMIA